MNNNISPQEKGVTIINPLVVFAKNSPSYSCQNTLVKEKSLCKNPDDVIMEFSEDNQTPLSDILF